MLTGQGGAERTLWRPLQIDMSLVSSDADVAILHCSSDDACPTLPFVIE